VRKRTSGREREEERGRFTLFSGKKKEEI